MHFLATAFGFLFLATSLQVLASPLSFTDIERRWSAGETDASIHAQHNPRSASPSWPLASRSTQPEPDTNFAESYDAVTQQGVIGRRSANYNSALSARIRDFVTRLLKSKGEKQMIASRGEDAAPVLRPRKVKYRFAA